MRIEHLQERVEQIVQEAERRASWAQEMFDGAEAAIARVEAGKAQEAGDSFRLARAFRSEEARAEYLEQALKAIKTDLAYVALARFE